MSEASAQGPPSFEEALLELERVVRDLEDGELGLDEALARYERGIALLRQCQGQLTQAEQRILLLTGVEPDGQPVVQPFRHEATARAVNPARPRKRPDSEY
jgi:exodeoxyribonuclease VII small subunit